MKDTHHNVNGLTRNNTVHIIHANTVANLNVTRRSLKETISKLSDEGQLLLETDRRIDAGRCAVSARELQMCSAFN